MVSRFWTNCKLCCKIEPLQALLQENKLQALLQDWTFQIEWLPRAWQVRRPLRASGKRTRSGRASLLPTTCHGESWHIAPVSGTTPVSAIPFEEYLKIFLCVPEIATLFPPLQRLILIHKWHTTIQCVGDRGIWAVPDWETHIDEYRRHPYYNNWRTQESHWALAVPTMTSEPSGITQPHDKVDSYVNLAC